MNHKTIILGISSGIAAYKMLEVAHILKNKNYDLEVIMTEHATSIVSSHELEKITGKPVYTNLFAHDFNYKNILDDRKVDHIELAKKANLFVIAPATANTIGKIAHGLADDFLTTTLLATTVPVLVCPSMNTNMWNHPAVQKNLKTIAEYGYQILEPESGSLACGTEGVGRLASVESIVNEIEKIVAYSSQLQGKKIIVTAGGTSEPIDTVRTITNRSSGKMGLAIAEECYKRGAEVLLIRAKSAVCPHYPIQELTFETSNDLEQLLKKNISEYTVIFHSAAVSDFTSEALTGKIDSKKPVTINLKPTTKIISKIKSWNPKVLLIGFKAVYNATAEEIKTEALEKITESNADFVVTNDVGKDGVGFGTDTNEVYLVNKESIQKIEKASKNVIAQKILDSISI